MKHLQETASERRVLPKMANQHFHYNKKSTTLSKNRYFERKCVFDVCEDFSKGDI